MSQFMINFVRMNRKEVSDFGAIVIFDGQCVLCGKAVKWLLKRDTEGVLGFTASDSAWAQDLFKNKNTDIKLLNSVALYENSSNNLYIRSAAIKRVVGILKQQNRLMLTSGLLYMLANDFFYNIVAKYRYKIFGTLKSCQISDEFKNRYIY